MSQLITGIKCDKFRVVTTQVKTDTRGVININFMSYENTSNPVSYKIRCKKFDKTTKIKTSTQKHVRTLNKCH